MVVATIPPITSGLTPSLKLFLYSVAPSGNVPLMWPWLASLALLSECMVSSELHYPLWYDTWHYYLIKFLYLTIAPKNSSFSLLYEEKNGVSILGDWLHTHLCFFHVRTLLRMPCNYSWRFGVHNVSLNAPCSTMSPMSYGKMEILWLVFFLEIWAG